jgi:hypothetical protein
MNLGRGDIQRLGDQRLRSVGNVAKDLLQAREELAKADPSSALMRFDHLKDLGLRRWAAVWTCWHRAGLSLAAIEPCPFHCKINIVIPSSDR